MNIDKDFSEEMLLKINNYKIITDNVSIKSFSNIIHGSIFDIKKKVLSFKFEKHLIEKHLKNYIDNYKDFGRIENGYYVYSNKDLEELGLALYPYLSFGILNGGASTSYFDEIKNKEFNSYLFSLFKTKLDETRLKYGNFPKGITPAYVNKNGQFGYSFFALKIRHLLNISKRYENKYNKKIKPSIFQMTSSKTNGSIQKFLDEVFEEDLIKKVNYYGFKKEDILTKVQPLVYCYKKLKNGQYKYFTYYKDNKENILALPAGHGQNFKVLKNIYKKLYKEGKRFVYIGNIDNVGFTINFKALAILAITNCSSGFEFSIKTRMDTKGGVLVIDENDDLNCVDIGEAISEKIINDSEKHENEILFNCATGLFNLEYLVKNIDFIIEYMPIRFIESKKEVGEYVLIEQITWEVLKIIDDPLIFSVDRNERFLPAKLFIDMLIYSNYMVDDYLYDIASISNYSKMSLDYLLKNDYGLVNKKEKWEI